ncbi:MAG: hypothetical protein JWN45_562 [Acidobacteriaceae bacterium]|nr:hypothetical protein [Acidobacteriaceae bacterium]
MWQGSTADIFAVVNSSGTTNSYKPSSQLDDYMLAGATVFITIVLALFFGILSGWAALAAILYAFGSRKELKANPSAVALGSRAHASTS